MRLPVSAEARQFQDGLLNLFPVLKDGEFPRLDAEVPTKHVGMPRNSWLKPAISALLRLLGAALPQLSEERGSHFISAVGREFWSEVLRALTSRSSRPRVLENPVGQPPRPWPARSGPRPGRSESGRCGTAPAAGSRPYSVLVAGFLSPAYAGKNRLPRTAGFAPGNTQPFYAVEESDPTAHSRTSHTGLRSARARACLNGGNAEGR